MDISRQSPPPHPGTHPLDLQYQHGRDDKHTDGERYRHSNEATIGTIVAGGRGAPRVAASVITAIAEML